MAGAPIFDITPPTLAPTPTSFHDTSSAQRASRSKLRNFFVRRKPSPSPETASTTSNNDEEDMMTLSMQSDGRHLAVFPKPTLAARTKSDTAVPQVASVGAKNRHPIRTTSRMSNVTEPKTFLYAYSKASLRSPARTFVQASMRSSHGSSSHAEALHKEHVTSGTYLESSRGPSNVASEDASQKLESSAIVEKLFVLGPGTEILQYSANGDPDRLPEKVLQLTLDSVVFPSDVFVGKGMALEVTASTEGAGQTRPKTNRSTWTINPFRSSTTKRIQDSLIMIFDDVEMMTTWLTSIRRTVESCGGRSSRPHSAWAGAEKPLPPLRSASTERFSLRQSFLHLSRSSTSLRLDGSDGLHTKEQALLPIPGPTSHERSTSLRSRTASSINTTTSLDRLRESDSNSTTTGTTNSLDGSIALDSPVKETFANIASPSLSIDSRTNSFAETFSVRSTSSPVQTLRERRKPSVSHLRLANTSNTAPFNNLKTTDISEKITSSSNTQKEEDDNNTLEDNSTARPVSILAPLPSPDDIKKPSKLIRVQSAESMEALDHPKVIRPASSHERHRSKHSTDITNKSMYSLFPKKRVEAPKSEPLVVPEMDNIPGLTQNHATDHLILPPTPTVAITPAVSPASTKNSSRKPSPIKLLIAREMEQPMRSPAVTDDMLASNFGTQVYQIEPSPISPSTIKVPTFEDLKFDFSFLKDDFAGSGRRRSDSPTGDRGEGGVRRMKSTPSLRVSRAPSAPLGPPPTGPLPAVPPHDTVLSSQASPQIRLSGEQRKGKQSRSNSPSSSTLKSPRESLAESVTSNRSSSTLQTTDPPQTNSPLAPVGMPSIISPPLLPTQTHNRQKSANKSTGSVTNHRRAKSSGKYSLGVNIKAFPSAPVLCDKPSSFYC